MAGHVLAMWVSTLQGGWSSSDMDCSLISQLIADMLATSGIATPCANRRIFMAANWRRSVKHWSAASRTTGAATHVPRLAPSTV